MTTVQSAREWLGILPDTKHPRVGGEAEMSRRRKLRREKPPRAFPTRGNLWDRWPNEPILWYSRFVSYLTMGPKRSITAALNRTAGVKDTWSISVASAFAEEWRWKERVEAWDEAQATQELDRQHDIMHTGLATEYERVDMLKKLAAREYALADKTLDLLDDDDSGSRQVLNRRYEILRNSLASSLADLAAETGGRVKRISVEKELTDYARLLAREEGYDEETALRAARIVIEGKSPQLLSAPVPTPAASDSEVIEGEVRSLDS